MKRRLGYVLVTTLRDRPPRIIVGSQEQFVKGGLEEARQMAYEMSDPDPKGTQWHVAKVEIVPGLGKRKPHARRR